MGVWVILHIRFSKILNEWRTQIQTNLPSGMVLCATWPLTQWNEHCTGSFPLSLSFMVLQCYDGIRPLTQRNTLHQTCLTNLNTPPTPLQPVCSPSWHSFNYTFTLFSHHHFDVSSAVTFTVNKVKCPSLCWNNIRLWSHDVKNKADKGWLFLTSDRNSY